MGDRRRSSLGAGYWVLLSETIRSALRRKYARRIGPRSYDNFDNLKRKKAGIEIEVDLYQESPFQTMKLRKLTGCHRKGHLDSVKACI